MKKFLTALENRALAFAERYLTDFAPAGHGRHRGVFA